MFFDHHLALEIPEDRVEDDEKVMLTRYTPLGVVGAIIPWNFPLSSCLLPHAPYEDLADTVR